MENRRQMIRLIFEAIREHLPAFTVTEEAINCHHNYVAKEHHHGADVWLTRKGAIRAGVGELRIVPGRMGAKSLIVRGKGNADTPGASSRLRSRQNVLFGAQAAGKSSFYGEHLSQTHLRINLDMLRTRAFETAKASGYVPTRATALASAPD